ncbi:MAG: ABC transporter permease [Alphaproteobacteria bacterium]|nr:MAG: ABC transporter permease [Alphaproteobacteria bacterium]
MPALWKKLVRDLARLWAQATAIALVLAAGIAILLTTFGMFRALDATRAAYYERNRFADVFASVRRAPMSIIPEIEGLDGVLAVEARVAGLATLDLPGRKRPAIGRIVSLPPGGTPRLNVPVVRAGRLPDPSGRDEVAVNSRFADANGFRPGDRFTANLNGRKRELLITGIVLSPEFIYAIGPGMLMPDNAGYGILWMPHREAAAAFDLSGAFNDLSVQLATGANPQDVIAALDRLLAPYGATGAHDRSRQLSNSFIEAELTQLKGSSMLLPPIFFAIAAFLVNMVMARLVTLERPQIGLLKAIGYTNREIALHYLMLAILVAVVGIIIGWAAGTWLARGLTRLYAQFFTFPFLIYAVPAGTYVVAAVLAVAAAAAGALRATLQAARLPPAVAMAPPAPPRFRRTLLEPVFRRLHVSQPMRMVLRGILRWPIRSTLTMLGYALAVAVLVATRFFYDSLDLLLDATFYQTNRQDVTLVLADALPETAALAEAQRLPGVLAVEGTRSTPVELVSGNRAKRLGIEARRPGATLSRVLDRDGRPVTPPKGGLLLTERVARQLGVGAGDTVEVRFLSGRREVHLVTVSGISRQFIGLGAFMDFDALHRVLREGARVTALHVSVDNRALDAFYRAVKDMPKVTAVLSLRESLRTFRDTIRKNVVIMNTVNLVIAFLITFGVAYNQARIQLSERSRELASLRILGFTRAEVSTILVGETLILVLVAQPFGWLIGSAIAEALARNSESDLYTIPAVLEPHTFAFASLVVILLAIFTVAIVRRRLDRLDLVTAMKTRE